MNHQPPQQMQQGPPYWRPYVSPGTTMAGNGSPRFPHPLPPPSLARGHSMSSAGGPAQSQLHMMQRSLSPDDMTNLKTPPSVNGTKVRKPYTITKQRERWAEEEHLKFLEALRLYGRAWRRIEEHIGTKTAVQIRSHAQKFFSKLERDASQSGGSAQASLPDIDIPPPRPKRKPSHPYPRKAGAAVGSSPAERAEEEGAEGESSRPSKQISRVASAPPTHLDSAVAAAFPEEHTVAKSAAFPPYPSHSQKGSGHLPARPFGSATPEGGLALRPPVSTSLPAMGQGSVKLFGKTLVVPTAHRAAALSPGALPPGLARAASAGDLGTTFSRENSAFAPPGAASAEYGASSREEESGQRSGHTMPERSAATAEPLQSERSVLESGVSMEVNGEFKEDGVSESRLHWLRQQQLWRQQAGMSAEAAGAFSLEQHPHGYFPRYAAPPGTSFEGPPPASPHMGMEAYAHSQYRVDAAASAHMAASAAAAMTAAHARLHMPGTPLPPFGPMDFSHPRGPQMIHPAFLPPGFPTMPPPPHHQAYAAYEAHLARLASFGPTPRPGTSFGPWAAPLPEDPASRAAAAALWQARAGDGGSVRLNSPSAVESEDNAAAAATMAAASAWWALQGAPAPGPSPSHGAASAGPSSPRSYDSPAETPLFAEEAPAAAAAGEQAGVGRETSAEHADADEEKVPLAREETPKAPAMEGMASSSRARPPILKPAGVRRTEKAARLKELKVRRSPGLVSCTSTQSPQLPACTASSPGPWHGPALPSGESSATPGAGSGSNGAEGEAPPSATDQQGTSATEAPALGTQAGATLSLSDKAEGGSPGWVGKAHKERRPCKEAAQRSVSSDLVGAEAPRKRPRGHSMSGSNSPQVVPEKDEAGEKGQPRTGPASSASDVSGGEGGPTLEGQREGEADTSRNEGPSSNSSACGNGGAQGGAGSSEGGSDGDDPQAGPADAPAKEQEQEKEESPQAAEALAAPAEQNPPERGEKDEGGDQNGAHGGHPKGDSGRYAKHNEVSSEGRKAFQALFTRNTLPREFSPPHWMPPSGLAGAPPESAGGPPLGVYHHYHYHYHSSRSSQPSASGKHTGTGPAPSAASSLRAKGPSSPAPADSKQQAFPFQVAATRAAYDASAMVKVERPEAELSPRTPVGKVAEAEPADEAAEEEQANPAAPAAVERWSDSAGKAVDCVSPRPGGRDSPAAEALRPAPFGDSGGGSPSRWNTGSNDPDAEAHRQRLSMLGAVAQSGAASSGGDPAANAAGSTSCSARFSGGGFQPYQRSNSGSLHGSPAGARKRPFRDAPSSQQGSPRPAIDTEPMMPLKKRPCPAVESP